MNLTIQQALQIALQHHQAGRLPQAEQMYRQVLGADPTSFEAHGNLGNVLRDLGRLEDAERSYRQALALRPDIPELYGNLGTTLLDIGQVDEAKRCYEQALRLKPELAGAHYSLGNALDRLGQPEAAERSYRQAIVLKPDYAEAHNNLGKLLTDLGRIEEAVRCYREAVAVKPDYVTAYSNFLFTLNYDPRQRPVGIYAELREFERRFCSAADPRPHGNDPDRRRRLRVGYVSGDFRRHSVAFFAEPILRNHDHGNFQIFCYFNHPRIDHVTRRFMSYTDQWRNVHALTDAALADLIRNDAIDVLVDWSGHTALNRLPTFGLKPAPVQVSYPSYTTTGLKAMGYRLTDRFADPPGENDQWYTEKLIYLPDCMWCFGPDPDMPAACPALNDGDREVAFGSFNYFAKLNAEMFALWAQLLKRVTGAKLIMTRVPGEKVRDALRKRFMESGVAADRLELYGEVPRDELVKLFARTDIVLDAFPYAGTTTTCDVMWMGIPVVTLAGTTTVSRSGASLLHAVGLEALVAQTQEQYVEIAATLATDTGRLAALRAGMRERMRSSPLMNETRFTQNLERAYRAMWQDWCDIQQR